MFEETFEIHEYEDQKPFEAAGQRVVAHRVLHYEMLAFGFRVSANGSTLAYSADSGPTDALVSLARDADLFLCEATLLQPNPEGGIRGHLSAAEANEAFQASGADRLLLTHRPAEASARGLLRAGVRRARARALVRRFDLADTSRQCFEERPGDRRVLLDERPELPRGQPAFPSDVAVIVAVRSPPSTRAISP